MKIQTQGMVSEYRVLDETYTVALPAGNMHIDTNNIDLNDGLFECMKYRGKVTIIVEVNDVDSL